MTSGAEETAACHDATTSFQAVTRAGPRRGFFRMNFVITLWKSVITLAIFPGFHEQIAPVGRKGDVTPFPKLGKVGAISAVFVQPN